MSLTLRSWIAVVLLPAGIACGPDPSPNEPVVETGWSLADRAYPFVGEHGEMVCAEWQRRGNDGEVDVEREYYHVAELQKRLDGRDIDAGALRAAKAAGVTTVATCEGARKFMQATRDYTESQPSLSTGGRVDAAQSDWLKAAGVDVEAIAASSPTEHLVANAVSWPNNPSPVVWVRIKLANGKVSNCSAVVVGNPILLMSAHCFPADGSYKARINHGETASASTQSINGAPQPPTWPTSNNIIVWRYPGYAGEDDVSRDLAIVQGYNFWVNTTDVGVDMMRFTDSVVPTTVPYWIVGYGADHNVDGYDQGHLGVVRRAAYANTIGWAGAGYWFTETVSGVGRPCSGDSGSPAINTSLITAGYLAVGIHSHKDFSEAPGICPSPGDRFRYTRIEDKIGWIMSIIGGVCTRYVQPGNGWAYYRCW